MAAKSIRKSVSFDQSDGDRALLDAIASHQAKHEQSFSDLCKQALHQYLLSHEPTQSVLLFMELQHQITQLSTRVAVLEDNTSFTSAFNTPAPQTELSENTHLHTGAELQENTEFPIGANSEAHENVEDPVISRLGPLLDDF